MTEEERRNRIRELLEKISPISYERTYISTKLQFDKEKYFNSYSEDLKNEIINSEKTLKDILETLDPLYSELRTLQFQYQIQYKAEYTGRNDLKYWETHTEILFFIAECNIDTTTEKGWSPYIQDPCVNKLLIEAYNFLLHNRFSNFEILNIRRI